MLPKQKRTVWAFATTTQALRAEEVCQDAGLPGRLIPTPADIRADCGLAWCAPPQARGAIDKALQDGGVTPQMVCDRML